MQPICSPTGRCVRVDVGGEERWGAIVGDEIVLSDGARIHAAIVNGRYVGAVVRAILALFVTALLCAGTSGTFSTR